MSTTVMFIHGAWLTPAAWGPFRDRFEAAGFHTHAPAWPFEDVPPSELRMRPDPALETLSIEAVVEHYESRILGLREPPILVGHGLGGLFVQLLLDRGLGVAGVALDPLPFRSVRPTMRSLWSALPSLLRWRSWRRTLTLPFEQFAADVAQTLPSAELRVAYDRWVVPTPGRIFWQAMLGIGTRVNVRNPVRAPLLLVAGEADRIVPPSMVRAAFQKQRQSAAVTALRTFPGRSHFLILERGWEEVADFVRRWATENVEPITVRPTGLERSEAAEVS
jgi:pimeloyl-ACP methyl ester carboxylesterase